MTIQFDGDPMAHYMAAQRGGAPEGTGASAPPSSLPEDPQASIGDPQAFETTVRVDQKASGSPAEKSGSQEDEEYLEATEYFTERVKDFADYVAHAQEIANNILDGDDSTEAKKFAEGAQDQIDRLGQQAKMLMEDYDEQVIPYAENNKDKLTESQVLEIRRQLATALQAADALRLDLIVVADLVKQTPETRALYLSLMEANVEVPTYNGVLIAIAKIFSEKGVGSQPEQTAVVNPPDLPPHEINAFLNKKDDDSEVVTQPVFVPPVQNGAAVAGQPVDANVAGIKPVDLSETAPHQAVDQVQPVVNPVRPEQRTFLQKRPQWQQDLVALMPQALQRRAEDMAYKLEMKKYEGQAQAEYARRQNARQWLSDQFSAMREMSVAGRGFDLRWMTGYLDQMAKTVNNAQPADKIRVISDHWNRLAGPEKTMVLALTAVVGSYEGSPMDMAPSLAKQYIDDENAQNLARILYQRLKNEPLLGRVFVGEYLPVLKDAFISTQMLQEGQNRVVGNTAQPSNENKPGPDTATFKPVGNPPDLAPDPQPEAGLPELNIDESKQIESLRQQNVAEIKKIFKNIDSTRLTPGDIMPGHVAAARIQLPRVVGVITMGVNSAEKYGKLAENLKKIGIESVLKAALAQEKFDPAALDENTRKSLEVLRT